MSDSARYICQPCSPSAEITAASPESETRNAALVFDISLYNTNAPDSAYRAYLSGESAQADADGGSAFRASSLARKIICPT